MTNSKYPDSENLELTKQGSTGARAKKARNELVKRSTNAVPELLMNCPNPTQEELRKLLAVQGHILNRIAMDLFVVASGPGKLSISKMNLALKSMASSRESLKAAASIFPDVVAPVPDGPDASGDSKD